MRLEQMTVAIGMLLLLTSPANAQTTGLWPQGGTRTLNLVRHDVDVTIRHPLAEVTVTQEFYNPASRALEAYYYYPVAPGATVSNLALWVNGVRREARLMERQKAREIYQGIVNQKRDPALVEKLSGNVFRIRIFPVPAKRRTRVELRFVQVVEEAGVDGYRLLIRKPPGKASEALRLSMALDVPFPLAKATLKGATGRRLQKVGTSYELAKSAAPQRFAEDIALTYHRRGKSKLIVKDGGDGTFLAEIPYQAKGQEQRPLAVLLDVSQSMEHVLPQAKDLIAALYDKLPTSRRPSLLPFDLLPRWLKGEGLKGEGRESRETQLEEVADIRCQGGSAFMPALERARREGQRQLVLLTDGGSRFHQEELEYLMRWVHDRPELSISVLQLGQGSNGDLLADIAFASGGLYLRFSQDIRDRAKELDTASGRVKLERLMAHRPRMRLARMGGGELHLVSAGAHRLIVTGKRCVEKCTSPAGRLPGGFFLPPADGEIRGVGALWATAEIDQLMRQIRLFGDEMTIRPQITALSKRFRVVSEYTAMLVTETDADYQRPTSGRKWQRNVHGMGEDTPSFHSTPEPHEWALVMLALFFVAFARRQGWLARQ